MKEPMIIGDIMTLMAANPKDEFGKCLRQCPFMQEKLMSLGLMSFDDLTVEESDRLTEWYYENHKEEYHFMDNLIDGQDVMQLLHISPRTLQTLRSNGTVPYTRIGHKIYYLRRDIERILRSNYVMFNIRERYGEE